MAITQCSRRAGVRYPCVGVVMVQVSSCLIQDITTAIQPKRAGLTSRKRY
jgi:hypothetical protein